MTMGMSVRQKVTIERTLLTYVILSAWDAFLLMNRLPLSQKFVSHTVAKPPKVWHIDRVVDDKGHCWGDYEGEERLVVDEIVVHRDSHY